MHVPDNLDCEIAAIAGLLPLKRDAREAATRNAFIVRFIQSSFHNTGYVYMQGMQPLSSYRQNGEVVFITAKIPVLDKHTTVKVVHWVT